MNTLAPKDYATAKARFKPLQRASLRQNRPVSKIRVAEYRGGQNSSPAPSRLKRTRLRAKVDRELAAWSKAVRERDDFTCQMTGIRDLQRNVAHHIAPRSRRPDLRLDVSNGVTLTPESHQWVHNNPIEATKLGFLSDATYELAHK